MENIHFFRVDQMAKGTQAGKICTSLSEAQARHCDTQDVGREASSRDGNHGDWRTTNYYGMSLLTENKRRKETFF